tara:strand:+ start:83 stop:721 length:639 start_codon:yes stop_codon:yes gene_type:complete
MSETKKKRGRKPKNKIISNDNPVFDTNNLDHILITCVKKPTSELFIDEGVIGHDKEPLFEEYNGSHINKCWNCSYEIHGEIYSYPISYHNNIFQVNGNFCSHECSARYIYDEFRDRDFLDKYYLLNFYVNVKKNTSDQITIPLSKLRLVDYGGDLTKEEYLDSKNISYDCYTPPCLYVNNIFYNNEFINTKETELKLFRKNKKKPPNNFQKI